MTQTWLTASAFDRYSNTLLVSLNNRISIRDTFGARRGAVDCQVATLPGSARSEATTDVMLVETEKQQKHPMIYQLAEVNMAGRIVSESSDLHFTVLPYPEQAPRCSDIA
jgi:hypothetical protein